MDPRVAEAALPYLTRHFANPPSGHSYADERQPDRRPEADNIVFTGSGSEADAPAIQCGVLPPTAGT